MPCLSSPQLALDAVAGLWEFNLSLFSLSIKEELVRFFFFFFFGPVWEGSGCCKGCYGQGCGVPALPCPLPVWPGRALSSGTEHALAWWMQKALNCKVCSIILFFTLSGCLISRWV